LKQSHIYYILQGISAEKWIKPNANKLNNIFKQTTARTYTEINPDLGVDAAETTF